MSIISLPDISPLQTPGKKAGTSGNTLQKQSLKYQNYCLYNIHIVYHEIII